MEDATSYSYPGWGIDSSGSESSRGDTDMELLEDPAQLNDHHHLPKKDNSMVLTPEERNKAMEIKRAVEQDEDLRNLSDMEYAQHALLASSVDTALQRIEGLQAFRDDYGIRCDAKQGVAYLERMMQLQPGAILHIDICPVTGEGIFAFNRGAIDPKVALQCSSSDTVVEENWKIHAIASYYLVHTVQPSLESTREGIFFLWDGHEMGWKNINITYTRRLLDEVWMNYPFKVKKVMEFNSNSVASIFWGLLKPLLPRAWTDVMEFGCQVEQSSNHTLTELYLQPTQEQAKQFLLQRTQELLELRARNEASFRL